jgi:hypothetical protein
MNWQFCPHCETELDGATAICPACRWDRYSSQPASEPERVESLVDRYRGTEYDAAVFEVATVGPRKARSGTRVRTLVIAGLIALIGLYGTMMIYKDFETRQDHPAGPFQGTPR